MLLSAILERLRRLVVGLSSRSPASIPRSVHVISGVHKTAVRRVFLRILTINYSRFTISPRILHMHTIRLPSTLHDLTCDVCYESNIVLTFRVVRTNQIHFLFKFTPIISCTYFEYINYSSSEGSLLYMQSVAFIVHPR